MRENTNTKELQQLFSDKQAAVLSDRAEKHQEQQENPSSLSGHDLDVGKEIEKNASDMMTSPRKQEAFSEEHVIPHNKELWNRLSDHKKAFFKEYYQKSDEAAALYTAVKAGSEQFGGDLKRSILFDDWQCACVERNQAAHTLRENTNTKELQQLFSDKQTAILFDRAGKHQTQQEKPSPLFSHDLEKKLQDNIDALLYRLFPEGHSGKDSKGYRFGSKGSLSVCCQEGKAGTFFDFEEGRGGGPLQLVMSTMDLSYKEARSWVLDFLGEVREIEVPRARILSKTYQKEETWISLTPEKAAPPLSSVSKGVANRFEEKARHAYRNEDGQVLFYTLRLINKKNGEKNRFTT